MKLFKHINQQIHSSANFHIGTSVHLIIGTLLLASCAQIVPPSGGERDKKPPMAVKYLPDSAQLNFNSKNIMIVFDEYAELKDLNNQLVISPPLEKNPEIVLKNKTLTIEFDREEKLKPNTTYCINFGNSIQDITENNPAPNFKYMFSTGSFIDSLTLTGSVENAFDKKPEKEVLVMLYSNLNDTAPLKNKPDYFAKTNSTGRFQINNIRAGKYKVFALKDGNANYLFDSETEIIGFIKDTIEIPATKEINISTFYQLPTKLLVKKYAHVQYGKFTVVFNKPADSASINIVKNNLKGVEEFIEFSKNKDTLNYWIKNYTNDSLQLEIKNGNKIIDTIETEMRNFEKAVKNERNPFQFELLQSPNTNFNFDLNAPVYLNFNNPIDKILEEKILLKIDSSYYKEKVSANKINSTTLCQVKWGKNADLLKENTMYGILALPNAITDIYGLYNKDTIRIFFKTRELKYYGTLKLKLTLPELKEQYIVQLIDDKENIIRENTISNSETLYYEYLQPLKYRVKIIQDENKNGKWDTGSYTKKIQPEKVMYFKETIQIRSNWDAEQEWEPLPNPPQRGGN